MTRHDDWRIFPNDWEEEKKKDGSIGFALFVGSALIALMVIIFG